MRSARIPMKPPSDERRVSGACTPHAGAAAPLATMTAWRNATGTTPSTRPTSRCACACSRGRTRCPPSIPQRSRSGARRRGSTRRCASAGGVERARGRPRRRRRGRSRRPRPARPAGSTTRPRGCPLTPRGRARLAGHAAAAARLLRLQGAATRGSTRSTTSSARTARRSTTQRRDARTDLTGRRALLTGGRAKIGMYIALRLLRDGAHTTITTRFPRDAVRRFARDARQRRLAGPAADRRHRPARPRARSSRSPTRSPRAARSTSSSTTPRRPCAAPPASYALLVDGRGAPLPTGRCPRCCSVGPSATGPRPPRCRRQRGAGTGRPTPAALTALALTAGSASFERIADGPAIDAGGLVPDLHPVNSWIQTRRRGRPARAARGAALQQDGAVHPHQPAAPRAGRVAAPGAPTSSTCRRWRASSAAATRARGTRTPTWPRPRSTC